MQLNLNETNLFNELSDEDQEIVAGGTKIALANGGYIDYGSTYWSYNFGGKRYEANWANGFKWTVT